MQRAVRQEQSGSGSFLRQVSIFFPGFSRRSSMALAMVGLNFAAAAVELGGLYSTKNKFAAARRKILTEHPTAYISESHRKAPARIKKDS